MGSFTAPFPVLRLLTSLKMSYEAAKKRAEPYTKIVEELPEMRRGEGALWFSHATHWSSWTHHCSSKALVAFEVTA
jgi:hypothetical protein